MPQNLIEISKILESAGREFIEVAGGKIRDAYPHNDYVRQAADMRQETGSNDLSIFGWKYFENAEQGIPPIADKGPFRFANVREKIYEWSKRKGMYFEKDYQRRSFAYFTRREIFFKGTPLYRAGGRKDLYTPAYDKLVDDITNKVSQAIIKTNIL